jgi:hypothetical protein
VILYTEDPALLEPVLRTQAPVGGTLPGIALPFGLAGELAGHAGLLAPGLSVYLTAFRGAGAGGGDAAEASALGLARSALQLREALGAGTEVRALLFHPHLIACYRLNLRLRHELAGGHEGQPVEGNGSPGGPGGRPVPQALALAAEGRPGALYECALRAGALL